MSNIITAYFKGRVGVAESVYQNDYGMVMSFDAIDLPAHFDCYFSQLNQEEGIPGVGADNQVAIPNSVLANPGTVTIHIPLHTGENDSEVEYVVYFKVIGRARPVDDGTPTQMTAIEQALALLQNPIGNIEQIVNEALSFTGETFEEMQEDLDEWKGGVEEDLDTWKSGVESDFDSLEAQFDTAVAAVTTDTEVTNIRVGADGVTYTTAGEAVRTQVSDLKSEINDNTSDISALQASVTNLGTHKVAQPLDGNNQPTNGTSGQSLRTKGDGTTEWSNVGQPTDEQTAQAVNDWLNAHPEATTTVQDHSLTYQKLVNGTLGFVTPEMFGAKGDGVTDDTNAFTTAFNYGKNVFISNKIYYCGELVEINEINDVVIFGSGTIKTDIPVLFKFTNCENVSLFDVNIVCEYDANEYEDVGEITTDPNGYNALSAIIDINSCKNFIVNAATVKGGYTGIYAKMSYGVYITYSEVYSQRHICVCCSSSQFNVSHNKIHGITNPFEDQYANYLFQATDSSETLIQEHSIIDGNEFYDNYNWDAIMSHIYSELIITNNHIHNVRTGIDLSPFANTHVEDFVFKNIIISNNIIVGTDQDVESPYSHQNNGITFASSTQDVHNIIITGNIIKNFCKFTAPDYCTVHISHAHKVVVSDNTIENATPLSTTYGNCIEIRSKCDSVIISNNCFLCPATIIAFNNGSVEVDSLAINGNVIDSGLAPVTFLGLQADSVVKNLDFRQFVPVGINNVRCPSGCTVNDITFSDTVDSFYYAQTQLQRLTYTYNTSIPAGGKVSFNVTVPYTIRQTDIFLASSTNRFMKVSMAYSAWKTATIVLENTDSAASPATTTINAVRLAL